MTTTRVGTIATLLAGLALTVSPVAAQDRHDSGDHRNGQTRGERRRPRDGNQGGDSRGNRAEGNRAEGNRADGNRAEGNRAEGNRQGGGGGERREAVPRAEGRGRNDGQRYDNDRNDRGRYDRDDRGRDRGRPIVIVPQRRDNRYYGRPNYSRQSRVYVAPYGYRPYGYRPGWSLNLYFGRPYGYGSRGYYGNGNYGYYSIPRGFAYGSLRIVDAPRDAQVFVDGYYAGVVDDYDGVFQRLNLEPGSHHIEVEVDPGAPPIEFDVNVAPGQTVTFHARY